MVATETIVDQILEWKPLQNADILAPYYHGPEIRSIADSVGESLELAGTDSLPNLQPRFELAPDLAVRALVPIERMLGVQP